MSTNAHPTPMSRMHWAAYALLLAIIAALGINQARLQGAQADEDPAAVVGGDEISMEELLERAGPQLDQVETQRLACITGAQKNRSQVLENNLEALVRERLSTQAAAAAGVAKEDWLAAEKDRQIAAVTDEEIDAFYEPRAAQLRQPKEQLADRIREYLAVEKMYSDLRDGNEVKVGLEPYRLDIAASGPGIGPETAKVTVVEFSDFECPFCERFNPTLEQVKEKYKDQVRIVFRQFPLNSIHPKAQKAAEASLCASDQGKFWEMHDLLFAEQKDLDIAQLKEKAVRLGLDASSFDSCLDDDKYAEQVARDIREGAAAGVSGTPSLFVNGRPLTGVVAFEAIAEIIDDELERAG
ncbi:MAG: thioredoxin domain-containing protein [Acidobacteriota bacterium]